MNNRIIEGNYCREEIAWLDSDPEKIYRKTSWSKEIGIIDIYSFLKIM